MAICWGRQERRRPGQWERENKESTRLLSKFFWGRPPHSAKPPVRVDLHTPAVWEISRSRGKISMSPTNLHVSPPGFRRPFPPTPQATKTTKQNNKTKTTPRSH